LILTYVVWGWVEPYYLRVLAAATRAGMWISELSFDPLWRTGTTIFTKGTGIYYSHRNFPAGMEPQGIPGDWIMANVVLLVALMLATPAPTWRTRVKRFVLAVAIVMLLQVIDIIVAIKVAYAGLFYGYWAPWARKIYQFLDAFFQSFDTQLFPFAIWAGIHFKELIVFASKEPIGVAPSKDRSISRAERRRRLARSRAAQGR